MFQVAGSTLLGYGITVLAVALALLLALLVKPLMGAHVVPVFLFAVMVSAWYGGRGPGLLATLCSALLIGFFFLPPVYSLMIGIAGVLRLTLFVLLASLINLLCTTVIRDAAERKKAEEERVQLLREQAARAEAEAANQAKDEFLAMVSHDLRAPLGAMLGWTVLLRKRKLDERSAARALETIERNARSQARLIEDLMDISRIVAGKLRLDFRPVDLTSVIEAAVNAVSPSAHAKAIQFRLRLDQAAGPVSGDPDRLEQIMCNLLSNAVKFTPAGGRVEVRLERTEADLRIIVSDTGKGITAELLPYIFDRFHQGSGSGAQARNGLGLGLTIVRHLVELHGGKVSAESRGEGQGATFTVTLPRPEVATELITAVHRSSSQSTRLAPPEAAPPF
jgi:signal transduction histidine kinase